LGNSLPGDTPQYMDSKFKPQAMDIITQWFKALTASCTGEAVYCRQQPGVFIHHQWSMGIILVAFGIGFIPLDIHHYIFPAELFKILRHIFGIGPDFIFPHTGTIAIPAIPSHWRGLSKLSGHSPSSFFINQNNPLLIFYILFSLKTMD
jgi:hypothetical protein